MKNRMRESRTSGSVGGEGGNILTYPATVVPIIRSLMRATGVSFRVAEFARI
jgi:hypothetical protein